MIFLMSNLPLSSSISGQAERLGIPGTITDAARDRANLRYIAEGWELATIADRLGLAEKTVRNRVSQIYRALGLQNRSELTLYYLDLLGWHGRRAAARATDGTSVP